MNGVEWRTQFWRQLFWHHLPNSCFDSICLSNSSHHLSGPRRELVANKSICLENISFAKSWFQWLLSFGGENENSFMICSSWQHLQTEISTRLRLTQSSKLSLLERMHCWKGGALKEGYTQCCLNTFDELMLTLWSVMHWKGVSNLTHCKLQARKLNINKDKGQPHTSSYDSKMA